ncbi:DNA topoisomerase IB [Filimonas effusa]|uniref:DNA topoisomerase n=1 Tax=Filimonas effusa TaxID=2508721 RepID=A0A4Q1DA84_9BACT|nr:DNA topoisomerase IB [Filimonas effusa]RXK86291.1 DNA topoisomerase IB [Filimonas effusa]
MADPAIRLTHTDLLHVHQNYEDAASLVKLVYVNDAQPGISRIKAGKGFSYKYHNRTLKDKSQIERIKKLVIPPAWENVWICPLPNGHIQATGFDVRKRKQYRYHTRWQVIRSETKFHHLYEFGKKLPLLRKQVRRDLQLPGLPENKVIALVISLMEHTLIRIGSNEYEKLNGSYGLTTLKDKHVAVSGDNLRFSFKGKKGVVHDIKLHHRKLAKLVKQCRDIPGKELFQYYDDQGMHRSLDSGMVNRYIKEITGDEFTAKDFRTWAGSVQALQAFCALEAAGTATLCRKNIVAVLDQVSARLGNTRAVCKKYYVHPGLIRLYEEKQLPKYREQLNAPAGASKTGLSSEEMTLMKLLRLMNRGIAST